MKCECSLQLSAWITLSKYGRGSPMYPVGLIMTSMLYLHFVLLVRTCLDQTYTYSYHGFLGCLGLVHQLYVFPRAEPKGIHELPEGYKPIHPEAHGMMHIMMYPLGCQIWFKGIMTRTLGLPW